MPKDKHTTIRLSEEGEARLRRLSQTYGSQVGAIEKALEVLEQSQHSAAPDALLDRIDLLAMQIRSALQGEFERRADLSE